MSTIRSALQVTIASLFLAVNSLIPVEAAGRTNQSVANTILNGKGAPSSALGINGDFYIDISTFNIYGPKSKNKWPTPISLKGPSGASGDKGSSSSGAKGDQGEKGTKGEKGESGAKGETGAAGAPGAAGAQGEQGLTGPTGPQGPQGETGPTGPTGPQGPTGATGATGAAGPSNVYFQTIPNFTLTTNTINTSSISGNIGSLQANKSYKFEITLQGRCESSAGKFGLTLTNTGSGSNLNYDYTSSYVTDVRSNTPYKSYHFHVIGTIEVGSLVTNLNVAITDGVPITGTFPMTISGFAVITLVGSVSG
jgi:hypothetical protein